MDIQAAATLDHCIRGPLFLYLQHGQKFSEFFLDRVCLMICIFFDPGCTVCHGIARSGELEHFQIIVLVAERYTIVPGNTQFFAEDLKGGGFVHGWRDKVDPHIAGCDHLDTGIKFFLIMINIRLTPVWSKERDF